MVFDWTNQSKHMVSYAAATLSSTATCRAFSLSQSLPVSAASFSFALFSASSRSSISTISTSNGYVRIAATPVSKLSSVRSQKWSVVRFE